MATKLPAMTRRGGNNHPIAVKQWILEYLSRVGEDHISSMHRAYNQALNQLAIDRRRKFYYHHPTYTSFRQKVWDLIMAGQVEMSGKEEKSDDPCFSGMKNTPIRKYVRLVR